MLTMISDISEDLLMEILCRLPVKSIIRCKCVCKPWRTLVATTSFIELYLNRANEEIPNIIIAATHPSAFYSLDSETCDEVEHLNLHVPHLTVIGSCNGLLCLSRGRSFVSFWNPSTREHVQLDSLVSSQRSHICEHERTTVVMGFGYDSVGAEYKLVKIEYFFDIYGSGTMTEFDRCEVRLYTLGTNSWRIISDTPTPPCYIGNLTRAAHFDGVLYWVGLRGIGIELSKSIISFDLRSEKFGEVPWPAFKDHSYRELGLGVLQGRLCTFSYHLEHVDVWVANDYTEENSWSWTRQFSIARSTKSLKPLVVRKSGEILLQTSLRNLILYDPVSEGFRVPNVRGIPERFRSITYVQSLISVASLMGMAGNRV